MPDDPEDPYKKHKAVIEAVIKTVCREFGFRREDAEDFGQDIRLHLFDKETGVLDRFEGRAQLHTYLYVVVKRKALDLRRKQWRRWRPSKAARDHGPAGVELEMLMMRDGYPFDQALAIVLGKFPEEDADALKALADGFRAPLKPRTITDEGLEERSSDDLNPEQRWEEEERQFRRERIMERVAELIQTRSKPDRLLFHLRFDQGMKVAAIARLLNEDQKSLYRRLDEIVRWVRKHLKDEGLL